MISKVRVCGEIGKDKACGKICCVCRNEIKAGEQIVSYFNSPRYRHASCQPKTSTVAKTIEEYDQQTRNAGKIKPAHKGRVIRKTEPFS